MISKRGRALGDCALDCVVVLPFSLVINAQLHIISAIASNMSAMNIDIAPTKTGSSQRVVGRSDSQPARAGKDEDAIALARNGKKQVLKVGSCLSDYGARGALIQNSETLRSLRHDRLRVCVDGVVGIQPHVRIHIHLNKWVF